MKLKSFIYKAFPTHNVYREPFCPWMIFTKIHWVFRLSFSQRDGYFHQNAISLLCLWIKSIKKHFVFTFKNRILLIATIKHQIR